MPASGTLSVHDDGSFREDPVPSLVRVLRCTAPLEASARLSLAGTLVLGRNDHGDDRMSSRHAQIAVAGRRATVTDLDSKNGTFVNGTRVTERELVDGDVLEIGHSFFVYRATGGD